MGKRVDFNHNLIVRGLRDYGVSVQSLAAVGKGCPDLLCGWHGKNVVLEVKNGAMSPSRRKLTEAEEEWLQGWRGQVNVVHTLEEALEVIGIK